jgi:TonB family protein
METIQYLLDDIVLLSLSKTLLHFIWQGAGLAATLYVILKLMDNQYSRLRYLSGLAILGLIVVTPIFTFLHFYDSASTSSVAHIVSAQQIVSASSNTTDSFFDWNSLLPIVSISWLLGVCWFSAQLLYEVHKVKLLPRYGTSPVDEHVQKVFDALIVQLKASKATRLMASTKAEVPMVIGWLKPIVLVPASMLTGLTPAQLEMLLAHELAHVKRHDYLINFFQNLVEVLFFFHPCVKWISNQIRVEREYCCDDIAVTCCGNSMAYARALTNAELIRRDNIPQLAMAATGGDLKKRVMRLVKHQDCSTHQSNNWLSKLFAGVAGIGLVFCFSIAPQLATADSAQAPRTPLSELPLLDEIDEAQVQQTQQPESIDTTLVQQDPEPPTESGKDLKLELDTPTTQYTQSNKEQTPPQNEVVEEPIVEREATVTAGTQQNQEIGTAIEAEIALETESTKVQVTDEPEVNITPQPQLETPIVDVVSSLNKPLVAEVEKAQVNYEKVVVDPELLYAVAPNYPRPAQRRQLEAEFSVTFSVNAKGRATDLQFEDDVKSFFKNSVKFALKKWRFKPGTIDGKTSTMQITRVFSFSNPSDEPLYVTGSRIPIR